MKDEMIKTPSGRGSYDERYYHDLYIKPVFTRIGLSKIYYLWIAFFCIKKAARLKHGARVLDFGCGIGNLVWALRKIGLEAHGLDPSKAAEKYSRARRFCSYGDTSKIPFEDAAFDLVYTHEVLEHLSPDDLWPSLREISRVSRGRTLHMICVKERGKFVRQEPTHRIIETESWWKERFAERGFRVKTGNVFYFFPFIPYLFSGTLNVGAIKKGYFVLDRRR